MRKKNKFMHHFLTPGCFCGYLVVDQPPSLPTTPPDSVGKAISDSYVQSPDCKLDEGQPQSHAISPGFGPFCQLVLSLPQVILIG